MSDTKPGPGLYLLDYDGDLLTGYEVVTVNSNGSVEIAIAEASFDVDAGRLTKLSIAADVRKAALEESAQIAEQDLCALVGCGNPKCTQSRATAAAIRAAALGDAPTGGAQ